MILLKKNLNKSNYKIKKEEKKEKKRRNWEKEVFEKWI